jgi:hypothetical protein
MPGDFWSAISEYKITGLPRSLMNCFGVFSFELKENLLPEPAAVRIANVFNF